MIFNSFPFLIFATAFFLVWPFVAPKKNHRWMFITAASLVFYGWWGWHYLVLLLTTTLVDYVAASQMARYPSNRKWWLAASVVANVGTLAVFKYSSLIASMVNTGLTMLGASLRIPTYEFVLPIGISFYTFVAMSYTIDVFRGRLEPAKNVFHFYSFLAFFPHLVAGPIVRGHDLLPQLETWRTAGAERRWEGLRLISFGLFKKMVLADNLAVAVNQAFMGGVGASTAYWWLIMTMFGLQIYYDFSGYTDIARGLAKWMGYELPINFNRPYFAVGVRDFWRRWHITLSTWFRDYVYMPMGGSRAGGAAVIRNLWITMLLCGLWHGASWTFVAWGAVHALYMTMERITDWPRRLSQKAAGRLVGTVATFSLVTLAWVFFRAETWDQSWSILNVMMGAAISNLPMPAVATVSVAALIGAAMIEILDHDRLSFLRRTRFANQLEPIGVCAALVACIYLRGPGQQFIYFQF